MGVKILVTGAAGFIGYHLCLNLLEKGLSVVGVDNINDYYDINLKFSRLKNLGIDKTNAINFDKEVKSLVPNYNFSFYRSDIEKYRKDWRDI